jgi:Fe-S oxidoreductase
VLAEMLRGESLPGGHRSVEVAEALDLCLSCQACATDCPVGVDMATYKAEFLHHHWAGRLRPRSQLVLGALPVLARWGAGRPFTPLLNKVIAGSTARRLAGLEVRRDPPTLARRTFLQWFRSRTTRATGTPVLLWPDTFTNYLRPEAARSAVQVLERLGHRVIVPDDPVCCGLTWHSTGRLDVTTRMLTEATRVLRPAMVDDLPVIGLEPSCLVRLARAAELIPENPVAHWLGTAVRGFGEFLAAGPSDLPRVDRRAIVQPHCHEHARRPRSTYDVLLPRLGIDADVVTAGCCGLAGNFGYERGHWDVAQRCAERELYPKIRAQDPGQLVIADGFSCHLQIRHGTGRHAVHLAEAVSAACSDE